MMAEECALIVAAAEPFPILSASPAWCNVFGVQEADLKGCGFKAFDDSFRPLIPGKLAEVGGRDALSPLVTAAMTAAIEQQRAVHLAAALELDAVRAAACQCPPSRSVALMVEPVREESPSGPLAPSEPPSRLRVVLKEQCIYSMKEATGDLTTGKATVLSHVGAPFRIAHVSKKWKELFGLEETESVGRSIKIIEGPLTQQATMNTLYEAVSAGVCIECELTTYHMDGRPHVNHLRVVPVHGADEASAAAPARGRKPNAQALAAAASGVTHCLWYMDAHEAVMENDAMTGAFCAEASKVLTTPSAPHTILDINQKWCDVCMLDREQVLGKTLDVVQGPATQTSAAREVGKRAGQRKASYVELINYRGDGQPFINRLKVHPVLNARTGQMTGCLGIVEQSMSAELTQVVSENAKPAAVVSASYPHKIVHVNSGWLESMMPDYMHSGDLTAESLVGTMFSSVALISSQEAVDGDKESDDLMKMCKGRSKQVLLAHRDALTGCGAWRKAAVAPVFDVADQTRVTHLVVSLDLSLAEARKAGAGTRSAMPTCDKISGGLLRRTCEEPAAEAWCKEEAIAAEHTPATGGLGLLRRTCEEPVVDEAAWCEEAGARRRDWRAVADPVALEAPRNLQPNGLLQRTSEAPGVYVDTESEEEYMDSEEEQELLGNQLPQEAVARALDAYLAQNQSRRGDDYANTQTGDDAVQAGNPKLRIAPSPQSSETHAALKQRTLMLSDDELLRAIRTHTRELDHYRQTDPLEDDSSDADDESNDDLRHKSYDEHGADGRIHVRDDVFQKSSGRGRRSSADEAEECLEEDDLRSNFRHRDRDGEMWSNSEVFTSVRVNVADGEAIAPIYDEYLRHLRAKCFVESWSWPTCTRLSIQVPFGRVEKATKNSSWCSVHAADLSTGQAWWDRLRYLVAVVQYNVRSRAQAANECEGSESTSIGGEPDKDRLETIMMPRGSVSREDRELGLACLRDINVIESWVWDTEEAVAVVVRVEALRAACAQSTFCNTWAPPSTDRKLETWGVSWLRMVWLTAQQPDFCNAVHVEDVDLDLETCLCSLHLHGLLPYAYFVGHMLSL